MGLEHCFCCMPKNYKYEKKYQKYRKQHAQAFIHDDILRYMMDTLNWIPSLHIKGSKQKSTHGLFFYGITLIDMEGAEILGNIVNSWKIIFENAPCKFELTCDLKINKEGKLYDPVEWNKILVERDSLVANLSQIHKFTEQVVSDQDLSIFHFGI